MGQLTEDSALRDRLHVFADRTDAGRRLALMLRGKMPHDAMVLAIPAGGVPVAYEIAAELKLPMDLMIVRKIQFPHTTEAGFGAVGPSGEIFINESLMTGSGMDNMTIGKQIEKTKQGIAARNRLFRDERPFPDLKGKTVILVDDGLAAGSTMTVAVKVAKRSGAARIMIAVPTAPARTIEKMLPLADEVYCLNVRGHQYFAVTEAYLNWYDVGDEEVLEIFGKIGRGGQI